MARYLAFVRRIYAAGTRYGYRGRAAVESDDQAGDSFFRRQSPMPVSSHAIV